MLSQLKNKKILLGLFLLYLIPRVFVSAAFYNVGFIGGDAKTYNDLSRLKEFSSMEGYFSKNEEIINDFQNYQFKKTNIFPYRDIALTTFWEPGWIFFVSLARKIGIERESLRIVQHLLVIILIYLWWLILDRPKFKKKYAFILFLLTTHSFYNSHPSLLYTEIFDNFLIALLYLFFFKDKKTTLNYICFGFIAGLLAITESFYLPLIITYSIYLFIKFKTPLKGILLYSLMSILVVTPVQYRNSYFSDGSFHISQKSALNFWIGNNHMDHQNWDQREIAVPMPMDYFINTEKYPEIREPCYVPYKEQVSCEAKNAIQFALKNPLLFIKRGYEKFVGLYSPNIFSFNYGFNQKLFQTGHFWSSIINNLFASYEIVVITLFFASLSSLIFVSFKEKTLLFSHLFFYHFVILWAFGQIRYRLAIMPLITVIIFLGIKHFDKKILYKPAFWLVFTSLIIFEILVILTKFDKVFYTI